MYSIRGLFHTCKLYLEQYTNSSSTCDCFLHVLSHVTCPVGELSGDGKSEKSDESPTVVSKMAQGRAAPFTYEVLYSKVEHVFTTRTNLSTTEILSKVRSQ